MTQRILNPLSDSDAATEPFVEPVYSSNALHGTQKWKSIISVSVLIIADSLAMCLAILIAPKAGAFWLPSGQTKYSIPWAFVLPILLAGLVLAGAYTPAVVNSLAGVMLRTFGVLSFGAMALGVLVVYRTQSVQAASYGMAAWAAAVVLMPVGRVVTIPLVRALRKRGIGQRPLIIIGTRSSIGTVAKALSAPGNPCRVIGSVEVPDVNSKPAVIAPRSSRTEVSEQLQEVLASAGQGCDFLIAAPADEFHSVEDTVRQFLPSTASIYVDLPTLLSRPSSARIGTLGKGLAAVRLKARHESWQYAMVKRGLDITIASIAFLIASPLMLLIALAIKLDSPGQVLFQQTRVGRYGRTFLMYKFRSMYAGAETIQAELMAANEARGPMFKIREDPRITRVGRFIRHLSLDELPQLVNVIQGNMSLIGPRPPLPDEVLQYEPWQRRRLDLLPGITGLWQVTRVCTSSFDEMVDMDITYADSWSLALDLKILLKTIPAMIMARGAY